VNNERMLRYVETLKKNTNRDLKVLYNGDTMEVLVAFTSLSQKGNEEFLKMYVDWLEEGQAKVQ
jgi:competence transcription factor ComK